MIVHKPFVKDPFVCPKKGISRIQSYDLGLVIEKDHQSYGSEFLSLDFLLGGSSQLVSG